MLYAFGLEAKSLFGLNWVNPSARLKKNKVSSDFTDSLDRLVGLD